jgi:hypothetical protein
VNIDSSPINLFYAYAEEDEKFRIQLENHLSLLKREGIISSWHFRMLIGGDEWRGEIDHNINNSQIILLLISSDFISSDYCYDVEMRTAMQLHNSQKARVIPVILRPVDWQTSPFSKLQALPTGAKPVTKWSNQDEAFSDVAQGIRNTCQHLLALNSADIRVSPISHDTLPPSKLENKKVYCARCGATPGQQSTCIGSFQHHDFMSYSRNVYCANCGAIPGKKSTCTGIAPYHDFKSYSRDVYCHRCGATPGQQSTCIGSFQHHDFMSYSDNVYCANCGAIPGKKSTCTGIAPYHDFKSYS